LSYDSCSGQFVLAFREQNFLTSVRVTRKDWNASTWPAAAQLAGTTTSTAPAPRPRPRAATSCGTEENEMPTYGPTSLTLVQRPAATDLVARIADVGETPGR